MIPASRKLALGFCCGPLEESDYTLSHTTILGDLLFTAERKYGARDKSWTILGIEICGLHPQIRYPRSSEGARFVSVMLSDAARMNPRQAVFQLAHEVIHLLAPVGRRGSGLVIEEGLATANSRAESISRQLYMTPQGENYLRAESLLGEFLSLHPDGIRRLREITPSFKDFSPDLICSTCEGTPLALAAELCKPFARGNE
jgi:hypothetical protein